MSADYTVSHYLLDRLKELGIRHVFGVPGDYAFPLINRLVVDSDLTWVGGCNEHNAGLAADGYARIHGIAASIYTCGPGELGAASALGGSYDDQVPVLLIAGHPPLHQDPHYVMTHHSLHGDFSRFAPIFEQLTVAHAEVGEEDPCGQLDEVLKLVWAKRRPGWLAIPKDVQSLPAQPPAARLELPQATSDPDQLDAFVTELAARLEKAEQPAILVDYPIGRYGLTAAVENLVEKSGIPMAITFGARGAFFEETADGFLGSYFVPADGDPLSDRISGADLLLRLALQRTETNMGSAQPGWHADQFVDVDIRGAVLGDRQYPDVALADVLPRLTDALSHRDVPGLRAGRREGTAPAPFTPAPFTPEPGAAMTENRLLDGISALLREGDVLVSDQGTCSAAAAVPKPPRVKTIIQNVWGAIGYGTPALLGALTADPKPRHILVTGDGGFQEVAQELSTILRHGHAPIVVLLNNGHYLVENLVGGTDVQDNLYNVINAWDYHKLPAVLAPDSGAVGLRVSTEDEWAAAVQTAEQAQAAGKFVLIEVMLAADDVSDAYRYEMTPTVGSR